MTIASGGIASGIDTQALIEQLVQIQQAPIDKLTSKKTNVQIQISKLGEIASKLKELKTALSNMDTMGKFLSYSGTPADTDLLSVSADGTAVAGSYAVTVSNLAVAEKDRSVGFASGSAEVKAGTISISINGDTAVDVTVGDGDTLADVASSINGADAGVLAAVVSDGTQSYLQITSKETGYTIGGTANDAISIIETYTGSTGTELGLTQTIQAENATFDLDGLSVTQTSNHVTDALPGVTLDLKAEGSTTFEITADGAGIKDKIKEFVDAYNTVSEAVLKELKVTKDTERGKSLAADPNMRRLRSDLTTLISSSVGTTGGAFDALSQIGIRTDSSGKLSIDSAELEDALNSDLDSVAKVFTLDSTGIVDALSSTVDRFTDSIDGSITLRTKSLSSTIDHIDDNISVLNSRLQSYAARLKKQFMSMETTISKIQSQGKQLSAFLSGLA